MELSDEQQRTLGDAIEIVSACPGAGKTRAIVAKFLQDVEASAKGVALVSFTNTAVDEISVRLSPLGDYPAPNFVGTFDRFVHQFILTPHVLRTARVKARYVDSWMDLGSADWLYVRDRSVKGKGIPLSDFVPDADGALSLSCSPSADGRMYIRQLDNAGVSHAGVTAQAKSRIEGLLAKHIYDCNHARIVALRILEGVIVDPGPQRLSGRFSEVIIDEFQDCSDIEYRIREQLRSLGINVVVVADADQGIYEFRNAKPQMFSALIADAPSEAVVELNNNYRSSKAICALVTSLRSLSVEAVSPMRAFDAGSVASVVYVLVGSDSYKRRAFEILVREHDIALAESVILAPTRKQAATLGGDSSAKFEKGHGSTGSLLVILAGLRHSRLSRQRAQAIDRFANLVLGLFEWTSVQLDTGTIEEKLEQLGLQPSAVRLCLSGLVRSSIEWNSRDDAQLAIQQSIISLTDGLAMQRGSAVSAKFQKPRDGDWKDWSNVADGVTGSETRYCHIHEVKGREFPAVLLEIPHQKSNGKESGFASWLADTDSETRRVLYVGASRAERVLALSIAKSKKDDLISILKRDGVPYELKMENS